MEEQKQSVPLQPYEACTPLEKVAAHLICIMDHLTAMIDPMTELLGRDAATAGLRPITSQCDLIAQTCAKVQRLKDAKNDQPLILTRQ
jgi:hypothetical protein